LDSRAHTREIGFYRMFDVSLGVEFRDNAVQLFQTLLQRLWLAASEVDLML
jgi:hypothetical protein